MTQPDWTQDPATQAAILAELTGQYSQGTAPAAITAADAGGKFTPDGALLHYPGNTFLCHVDPGAALYGALAAVQDELRASTWADHFSFLPKPSFHMTIFCGVSGVPLGGDGWPEGLPRQASLAQVNQRFANQLSGYGDGFSVRMRPIGLQPNSIYMGGLHPEDHHRLNKARSELRRVTGLSRPNHDTYRFHISLGYLIKWMDLAAAQNLLAHSEASFARHLRAIPPVEFDQIEFCEFETMHGFDVLSRFG